MKQEVLDIIPEVMFPYSGEKTVKPLVDNTTFINLVDYFFYI